jgi:PBP superfamily domain
MPIPASPFLTGILRFTNYVFRFSIQTVYLTSIATLLSATGCSPLAPTATPELIRVQYSFTAQPWLDKLSGCAAGNTLTVALTSIEFQDLQSADLAMRFGQPEVLTTPAYQIGTDDLLVIVNRQNPINHLTFDQVRGLFTGQIQTWKTINKIDSPILVWVFPTGEDVQQIFDQSVLGGSPITSTARLANSPDEMSQAIAKDVSAVGIITRHWKAGNTSEVFTVAGHLPVLAISQSKPKGSLLQILACLQK